jgi:hypothetical protein
MMAIVDAKTGTIYSPPLADKATPLSVPMDNLSDMEIDVRPDSSLTVLRNACRDYRKRSSCGTYFFNWQDNRFELKQFVFVDPLVFVDPIQAQ